MASLKQVQDVLNKHFVCIEFDPTGIGVPADKYAGLWRIGASWENNPWTRVSFGSVWLLEPGGQYMLIPATDDITNACNKTRLANLDELLEQSLETLRKIRAHRRGSPEEAEAIRSLGGSSKEQWIAQSEAYLDARTKQIFVAAKDQNDRYPGIFENSDPWVRRRAIELVGRYSRLERDQGFLPGGQWSAFGEGVASCLDDEDAEVRLAAASTLFEFGGAPVPSLEGSELVSVARERWARHRDAVTAR